MATKDESKDDAFMSGDHSVFLSELYIAYRDSLYRIAYRNVGSPELAEDLVQTVFLVAQKDVVELSVHPVPNAYLFNTLGKVLSNEGKRKRNTLETSLDENSRRLEKYLLARSNKDDGLDIIDAISAVMPTQDRDLLLWRIVDELSFAEIANQLGMTEDACRQRYRRKLKLCQSLLAEERENFYV